MKRLLIGATLAIAMFGSFAASADDVRTPEQCAGTATADDPTTVFQMGNAPGRGSYCVSDGDASNGNELYIGGDATMPCGHIEVAGQVVVDESGQDPATYCH
jgi:hypothetical protein